PPVPAVLPTPEPGAEVATKAPAGSRRGPSVSRRRRLAEVILRARLVRDAVDVVGVALGAVGRVGRRLQRLPRLRHRRIEALRDADERREEDDVRGELLGERTARAEDEDDRRADGREADRDEAAGRLRETGAVEQS